MISGKTLLMAMIGTAVSTSAMAQSDISRNIELGALFTSGNTDEQSLNFGAEVDIDQERWDYRFTLDGLYTSSEDRVKAQKMQGVARANYQMSEISYFQTRASHEDDRFSGFASQSDLTFSYGRDLLVNRGDMSLSVVGGIGVRWTRFNDGSDSDEPILRFAGEYEWTLSDSAVFNQDLSMEAGSKSDIYRSESSIETDIMENLSLRFSFNIKHQTDVPVGKKKTDTQTAITFVMDF
jgi:putative salt-induced outer membrane protein